MIRPLPPASPLTGIEAFGLAVLLDHSRLLPMAEGVEGVLSLAVTEEPASGTDPEVVRQARPGGTEGVVTLSRGVLAAAGRLAGAVAEQGSAAADRLGRVPSAENPGVAAGTWQDPLVTGLAQRLRASVVERAGTRLVALLAPWPDGRRWAACLTSDLDLVTGWPAATAVRVLELLRHGEFGRAAQATAAGCAALAGDPVGEAAFRLLAALETRGFRGTWFVIAGTPTLGTWRRGDITYRPEAVGVRRILARLREGHHEVGLHGSFTTILDGTALAAQRARLEQVGGGTIHGVRQHFLRMRPGRTQRAQRAAGFRYDATFGFPDRNGFRLATADMTPGWDAEAGNPSGLELVPLAWMDRALSKYAGIEEPAAWVAEAHRLAATVRALEGLWVGLWHPNLAPALGYPGTPEALNSLLDGLERERPYVAPLGELVAWRTERRSARGVALSGSGVPVLRASSRIQLEDAAGRPLPSEASG